MRKIMAAAIALLFAGVATSWALVGIEDVSYDGSLEVVGMAANNEADQDDNGATSDRRGETNTRVRLGINGTITEGVKGRVELTRTGSKYGRNYNTGNTGAASATTIDDETANINIDNAYVDIEDLFGLSVRLGRQYIGNKGDLVFYIGPNDDDNLSVNSIDGLLLKCRHFEGINVDLFTGKFADDDAQANTDTDDGAGDVNINSLDVVLPNIIPNGKINAGYLWGTDANTTAQSDNNKLKIYRVGVKGSLMEEMLAYRAEYFMNGGEFQQGAGNPDRDYKGNCIDLGIGVNISETAAGPLGLGVNYLLASGDDNVLDNDDESFRDFSAIAGNSSNRYFGEIFGKSNALSAVPLGQGADSNAQGQGLQVIHLYVNIKPTFVEKTYAQLDFYDLSRAEDKVNNVNVGDDFGTEIDLTIGYNHSENVNLEIGYANLSPDDAIVGVLPNTPDDNITKLFAKAKIKWGGEEE